MAIWLSEFIRNTHDPYGFGYACAYTGGKPWPITTSGRSRGLIHSTEGSSLPGYRGGKDNPNATVDPWRKRRWQHVPFDIASRATMANNHQFVQIEIIGFCDLAYAKRFGMERYYLEEMGSDELDYIAESLSLIGGALSVPTSSGVTWERYPRSAWAQNGVRLTTGQLTRYTGWLGHQHAPKPDVHGDPGIWPHAMDLVRDMTGGGGGGSHAPIVHKPRKPGKLAVDGCAGTDTTNALEWIGGNHQPDGHFSNQSDAVRKISDELYETFAACWPTMQWVARSKATGSRAIAWLQGQIGVKADGVMGPHTIKALQKFLGVKVDGLPGPATVKALQRWINKKLGY